MASIEQEAFQEARMHSHHEAASFSSESAPRSTWTLDGTSFTKLRERMLLRVFIEPSRRPKPVDVKTREITGSWLCLLVGGLLSLWMTGCSSVPGLSVVSDAIDLQKLSTADPLDLKDEDVQAILQKPVPPPPGMSHDVGQLRRAAAAFALGDLRIMRQVMTQAKTSVTNSEVQKNLLALGVTTEALHGNFRQALKDAADFEARMQAVAKRTRRPVLTTLDDIDAIYRYIEMAYAVGDFSLAERVRKQYLEEIIQNTTASPAAKAIARLRNGLVEGRLIAFKGDLDGGYEHIRKGLDQYQREFTSMQDRAPLEQLHENRLGDAYLALGQIALAQGRFSQALQHLLTLRAKLQATNRLTRPEASPYYMLDAAYWGSLGEYERAIQSVDARWKVIPPRWHELSSIKAPQLIQRAGLMASLGRWEDAWNDISQLNEKDLGDEGVQRDYALATRALIASVLGKSDSSIDSFLALERKYRQWRGTDLGAAYFAGKVMVHYELSRDNDKREKHLALAVSAGRELSYALSAKLARGGGREANIGPTLLRKAKESYLKAASSMAGRSGVSMEDVLDALQISQSNETDMDVSSAAARLTTVQGLSSSKLRELQDLQQKARGAQARVSEYSRVLDADEGKLASYVSEANQITSRLDRMLADMRGSAPQLIQAFGNGSKTLTSTQLQQRLSGTEALLVLVPMPGATFALFSSKGTTEQRLLSADSQQIDTLVKRIRRSVTFTAAGAPPFDTEAAQTLHEELFGWLEKRIGNVTSLTVSATGPLGAIPFGLLIPRGAGHINTTTYSDIPWLVRSMAVTHVPTLSSWLVVTDSRARPAVSGFQAWADPDFTGKRSSVTTPGIRGAVRLESTQNPPTGRVEKALSTALPNLPETADEALGVARTLGASQKDILFSDAATRNSVVTRSESGDLARKSVLMFATHGLAPADIPGLTQPALALAQEAPGQGPSLLLLDDVVGLRLNADWVVLSACNTASADRVGGDPLSGLARGFFFAGARGMLVTHWEVETRSAAEITRLTFDHYVRDRSLSRAQALQKAATDMISGRSSAQGNWSHPAYWAPYALVGSSRRGGGAR